MIQIPIFKIEYLSITLVLSEWGFYPAPTFRVVKNMSEVMLHFLMHICEHRIT